MPSPCGPNSICKQINNHAVCTCLPNFIGSPPTCRPECIVSSECQQDRACINQRCSDPCPGTCGLNARCQVLNHNPICSCTPGFTGDPFVRCLKQQSKKFFFFYSLNISHFFKLSLLFLSSLLREEINSVTYFILWNFREQFVFFRLVCISPFEIKFLSVFVDKK